jgi:hypothetical protein
MTTNELVDAIKGTDEQARGKAWQNAGPVGVAAVKPLAEIADGTGMETPRAAKRALWNIVRYAGRPGAGEESKAVAAELASLIRGGNINTRRELIWMLSELGGDAEVRAVTPLLAETELREDARAALQRIPGRESLRALQAALKSAPEDYKPAVAVSLRVRGEKVDGYPSGKLAPSKRTEVNQTKTEL